MITLATQQLDVFFASPDADVRSADIQTDLHLPIYQSASPPQPLPSDAAAHAAGTPLSDGGGAQSAGADYVLTPFDRLLLALVAEHALIAMKLLLHVAYPELPELLLADAKQAERELHKKYLLGVHGKVDTLSRLSPSDAAITSLCPQSAPTGKATTVTVRGEHLGRAVHRGEISLRLVMPKDGSHKESYKESARRAHSALTLPADFVSDRCLSCLLPASEIAGLATITLLPRGGGIAAVDGKDAGACDVDGQSCAFRYYTPCTLLRLKPNTGPLQGGTLVSCAGRGFVSTGEIVARFSAGGLDHCVPAAFISESEIRFISPNLHESGGATVTIALNGTDFEPEGLTFYYQSRACAVQ
uniref:IPT/TIG domain-containing protein n=2 Tax=Chrysotila carterae TaxID=13221 RepID=A0A7S4BIW8_CHRCT